MRIECERLLNGGKLDGVFDDEGFAPMRVVLGHGRGCVLQCNAAAVTLLIPLRGRLQMAEGESTRTLRPGELLVLEPGQRLQAIGRGSALWIAAFVPARVWQRLAGSDEDAPADPPLIPALHRADRPLRRAAVRLARLALAAGARDETAVLTAASVLAAQVSDLQAEFDLLIDRCPGRTLAQRRSVFLRLQRVRNYMASSCHLDLDIADFARMASYSPCHFIRAFSTVFGETPHAVLVEQRLNRAHRLINDSALAITEVARASGFENRCAFSRSFKRRFGITASDLREAARSTGRLAA